MQIYLVGGAVRDQLLGLQVKDRDYVVVGSTPEAMQSLGFRQIGQSFPVFLHPETQDEYALARAEKKQGQGHQGFICDFSPDISLEQDLLRRDLTINAMAQDAQGQIIDPYGGQLDLEQKRLHPVSAAFNEDPLRVLRTARFAAKLAHLGFQVSPECQQQMQQMADGGELASLSPERVLLETQKALLLPSPWRYFEVLQACNALSWAFPQSHWQAPAADFWQDFQAWSPSQQLTLALHCLYQHSSSTDLQTLFKARRFDNLSCWLSLKLLRHGTDLAGFAQLSAEQRLETLNQIDLWRKESECEALAALVEHCYDAKGLWPHLQSLRHQCLQLDHQSLQQQGLKGQALGQAIQRHRLDVLKKSG